MLQRRHRPVALFLLVLTPAIATAQGEKLPGNTGRMREAMDELLRAFMIDFAAEHPK